MEQPRQLREIERGVLSGRTAEHHQRLGVRSGQVARERDHREPRGGRLEQRRLGLQISRLERGDDPRVDDGAYRPADFRADRLQRRQSMEEACHVAGGHLATLPQRPAISIECVVVR
jgi:hypothetical protein